MWKEESFKTLIGLDMLKYVNECKNQTVRKKMYLFQAGWMKWLKKK